MENEVSIGTRRRSRIDRRRWILALSAFAAIAGFFMTVQAWRANRWKRFGVVEAGRIYRSGHLTAPQLESAIAKLHLRTVVCLNPESAASDAAVCRKLGIQFRAIEMPADGLGEARAFSEVLATLTLSERQPVLVHCQAGVARTGACVALHRVVHDGWSIDRAVDELRSFERHGRIEPKLRDHITSLAGKLSAERR